DLEHQPVDVRRHGRPPRGAAYARCGVPDRGRRPGRDAARRDRLTRHRLRHLREFPVRRPLTLKAHSNPPGAAVVLGWFANVNLFVLIVNLLPALPLDGGRILRALVWWRTGDRNRATRAAARMGRGFAFVL